MSSNGVKNRYKVENTPNYLILRILLHGHTSSACGSKSPGESLLGLPPELLRAISMVESGQSPKAINLNKNKSNDIGHMQINSCWKEKLGYRWTLLDDPACCTLVGAWILRGCIDRYGYNWNAVACYHTGYSIDDAPTQKKRSNGRRYIIKAQKAFHDIKVKKNRE